MALLCLGFSHHDTPLEVRASLAYAPTVLEQALGCAGRAGHTARGDRPQVTELTLLSTCNRFEAYAVVAGDEAPEAAFERLVALLAACLGDAPARLAARASRRVGCEVAQHLGRVAAGLDSMVLGESEILGQVASAHRIAARQGASGPILATLFRAAIGAGRRARTETGIGRGPATMSAVAVQLGARTVGEVRGRCVAVIGAGRMGRSVALALRAREPAAVLVANRSPLRGAAVAREIDGELFGLERLPELLTRAQLVVCCAAAPAPLIRVEELERVLAARNDGLVLVDIAVPPNVERAAHALPGARVLDLDDLQACLETSLAARRAEVPRAERLVAEEMDTFERWLASRDPLPSAG